MASKKASADEAYRRAEAQRALVVVLGVCDAMTTDLQGEGLDELKEAAAVVRREFLKVSEPKPRTPTLKGQLDIDGSVEGEPARHIGRYISGVPDECPGCGAEMFVTYGGSWTALVPGPEGPYFAQCGRCSYVLKLPDEGVWQALKHERQRTIGASDKVERALKEPKTRGAG